jgi:plastocyanin
MIRAIARHAMVVSMVGAIALSACSSGSDSAGTTAAPDATDAAGPVATDAGAPGETDPLPVEATEPTAAPAPADGATLTIKEFAFSAVTATAGQPFTLSNEDGFAHTVTNRDDLFDVRVEGGTTESLTVAEPGTYDIFCRIHPSMSGTITVV